MQTKKDRQTQPKTFRKRRVDTPLQDTANPVLDELLGYQQVLNPLKNFLSQYPEKYTAYQKKIDALEGESRIFQSQKAQQQLVERIELFLQELKQETGDLAVFEATLARFSFNLLAKLLKDTVPLARDFKVKIGFGQSEISPKMNDFIENWHLYLVKADAIRQHLRANQNDFNQKGINTSLATLIKLGQRYQQILQKQLSLATVSEAEFNFMDDMVVYLNGISDSVVANLEQAEAQAVKLGKELIEDAEKTAAQIRGKIEEEIESTTADLPKKIDEIKNKLEEFKDSGTEIFENLAEAKNEFVQEFTENVELATREVRNTGKEARDSIIQKIEEKREEIIEAISPELTENEKYGIHPDYSAPFKLSDIEETTGRMHQEKIKEDLKRYLLLYKTRLGQSWALIDELRDDASKMAGNDPEKAKFLSDSVEEIAQSLEGLSLDIANASIYQAHQQFRNGIVDKKLEEIASSTSKLVDRVLPELDQGLQRKFMLLLLAILDVVTLTLTCHLVDTPVAFTTNAVKLVNLKETLNKAATVDEEQEGLFTSVDTTGVKPVNLNETLDKAATAAGRQGFFAHNKKQAELADGADLQDAPSLVL